MHYHNNMHQRFKLCCYHPNSNTYIHACIYTHVNTYSTQHSHTLDVYLHYCCCWHQLTSVFFKKLRSLYEGINRHPTLCHQSCAHNLKRERERDGEREREREREEGKVGKLETVNIKFCEPKGATWRVSEVHPLPSWEETHNRYTTVV